MTKLTKKAVSLVVEGKVCVREVQLNIDGTIVTGMVGKARVKWDTKKYDMPSVYFTAKQPKGDELKRAKELVKQYMTEYKKLIVADKLQRQAATTVAPQPPATAGRKQYVPGSFSIATNGGGFRTVTGDIYKGILGIATDNSITHIGSGLKLTTAADNTEARRFVKALEKVVDWKLPIDQINKDVVKEALKQLGASVDTTATTVEVKVPVDGAVPTIESDMYND